MARCYQPNDVLGLNKLQLPGCEDKNHLSLSFAARTSFSEFYAVSGTFVNPEQRLVIWYHAVGTSDIVQAKTICPSHGYW